MCNEKMAQIFKYENVEDFINEYVFSDNYVEPELREWMLNEVKKAGIINNVEIEFYGKDKSKVWACFDTRIFPDKGYMEDVVMDITEHKKAAEEMQFMNTILLTQQETSLDGILVVDEEGKMLSFNTRFVDMWNIPSDVLVSRSDERALQSVLDKLADPEEFPDRVKYLYEHPREKSHEEIALADGRTFERYSAPMLGPEEERYYGRVWYFRDITDRVRAEEEQKMLQVQLHRSQKMEAMGLMAGGVAHDLNNILSGIVSYPELLLMDLPEDSPLREPIKTIKESGMRAVDVVADLLTIARGVATGKEVSNLNTLIEEYLNSAEHQKLAETYTFIIFKTEIDSDLLNISCSSTHIKKTLMNLVINASEASEGSGTVAISTLNRYLDEPLKSYEDVRTGEYVMLTISDDGSGISPGDLERIFEPFYTKKVMGRSGTGLGLAVVWNTVQDHKGYINVKSSEKGTVFELYFPVTREKVAAEKVEVPLDDYLGHGEKILVVDDEERQREIASGILTRLGYNAEAVSSGEEAIEYVKENPVDLIVLDMVMPKGINGVRHMKR